MCCKQVIARHIHIQTSKHPNIQTSKQMSCQQIPKCVSFRWILLILPALPQKKVCVLKLSSDKNNRVITYPPITMYQYLIETLWKNTFFNHKRWRHLKWSPRRSDYISSDHNIYVSGRNKKKIKCSMLYKVKMTNECQYPTKHNHKLYR